MINLQDYEYLRYRSIIRNPKIKPLGNIVPGFVWSYLGNRASKKSRARSGHYRAKNEANLVTMIRAHAERVYDEKPFDVIISGHMHVFDDHTFKIKGHNVRSVNLGSWFEEDVRVFRLKDGEGSWVTID
ncbi:UDP-2,3-diacylglucosamine hydrolase [compost metagenome]